MLSPAGVYLLKSFRSHTPSFPNKCGQVWKWRLCGVLVGNTCLPPPSSGVCEGAFSYMDLLLYFHQFHECTSILVSAPGPPFPSLIFPPSHSFNYPPFYPLLRKRERNQWSLPPKQIHSPLTPHCLSHPPPAPYSTLRWGGFLGWLFGLRVGSFSDNNQPTTRYCFPLRLMWFFGVVKISPQRHFRRWWHWPKAWKLLQRLIGKRSLTFICCFVIVSITCFMYKWEYWD